MHFMQKTNHATATYRFTPEWTHRYGGIIDEQKAKEKCSESGN